MKFSNQSIGEARRLKIALHNSGCSAGAAAVCRVALRWRFESLTFFDKLFSQALQFGAGIAAGQTCMSKDAEIRMEVDTSSSAVRAQRRAKRHVGQRVRVTEVGDRYHRTIGEVVELVPAFGTVLYRVSSKLVIEYGRQQNQDGWSCLFFPDQLRSFKPVTGHMNARAITPAA